MKPWALIIFLMVQLVHKVCGYQICKTDLLYSYGVLSPKYTNHTSLMCSNDEPESCCSYNDETRLTREWSRNNQYRIKPYMASYIYLMKKIFNYYEDLIVLAKYIYINPNSSETCKAAAESMVVDYIYREEVIKFVDRLEILLNNIASMRKGFYCSLCSVYNQRFFDTQTKKIIFSNDFCENLVEFSVSEIHYKAKKVLPVFSRMNTVINCKDNVESPEEMKIELDKEDVNKIHSCYVSYVTSKDPMKFLGDCIDYCKTYSMSEASDVFEGNLGRLDYLHNKIVESGLIANDLIFLDLRMDTVYFFYKLNPEFFENKLSFEDFQKYENVFEPNGLEPFTQSTQSLYHYQMGKNPLKLIREGAQIYVAAVSVLAVVLSLFK